MKKKILIIEDDKKISNLIKAYLENAGFLVQSAFNIKQAIEFIEKEKFDLAILDLMLPDGMGETLVEEFSLIKVPVIMVTAKASEEEKLAGFSLGADDYVTKPFSPRELVARVKAVLKRYSFDEEDALSFNKGALVINSKSHCVFLDRKEVVLTPTEFKILLYLAQNYSKVVTREDIIDKVFGYQFEGYERTVDTHIKNLRHKLKDDPKTPKFIQTVHGVGYRFLCIKDEI
ncbi:MAG: response regulator transcription factor [Proteobacteria bacterium]|nr:response regulator transcription factor [Pseudomonadota bacterium]